MAKKYESEIDPDEFIRSFREEPSSLSSLNRKPKGSPLSDATGSSEQKAETALSVKSGPEQPSSDEERERLFRERFITRTTYLRPQVKFLMVEIDPVIIGKIKRLIASRTVLVPSNRILTTCWPFTSRSTPTSSTPNSNQLCPNHQLSQSM